jgi:23S rRNA pseudouridine1911/1915/1917 synthase
MLKSKQILVPKECDGERFDIVAAKLFPEVSRKKIKLIIDSGGAYLNKKRIQIAKYQVKYNDKIEIFWQEVKEESSNKNITNKKNSFLSELSLKNIIFENELFIVINKPAGIASQATLTSSKDTIFYMLEKLDKVRFNTKNMFMVHRLDKDTSGVMLIAKSALIQKQFEDLFRDKKIIKIYDALCFYLPKKNTGIITYPIAKDRNKPNCYFAVTNTNAKIKDAKTAETEYKLIRNYSSEASLIQCFPKTGRTHQIRVHLSSIGCPIIGDRTYSQNIYGHRYSQIAFRQMLHASTIRFELNSKNYEFSAPYPADFEEALSQLEK